MTVKFYVFLNLLILPVLVFSTSASVWSLRGCLKFLSQIQPSSLLGLTFLFQSLRSRLHRHRQPPSPRLKDVGEIRFFSIFICFKEQKFFSQKQIKIDKNLISPTPFSLGLSGCLCRRGRERSNRNRNIRPRGDECLIRNGDFLQPLRFQKLALVEKTKTGSIKTFLDSIN